MLNRLEEYFRYPPTSPRDQQWGLFVTGAGHQPVPPQKNYPPEGHPVSHDFAWERGRVLDQFGVVYLVRGKGEFESKHSASCEVSKGDAFFVFPGVWHRYRPLREVGWEVYWIHFQGEDAQRLLERGFISSEEPVLDVGVNDLVLDLFMHQLDWLRAEPVGFQQMLAANTLQIVATMLSVAGNRKLGDQTFDQIRRAKALLEEDWKGTPQMDRIAAELNMSRAQFYSLFKEHIGLSPYQYHLESKLNRARQVLQNSDLSIKQIARMLGFNNVYHFSNFFKNKTGMAPTQWRSQSLSRLRVQ